MDNFEVSGMIPNIVVSIIGSVILYGLIEIIKLWIIPGIRNQFDASLKVAGTWTNEFVTSSKNEHKLTIELHQKWRKLAGNLKVIKKNLNTGDTEVKEFSLTGSIKDRFVILSMRNAKQTDIGVRVDLLEIIGDGGEMRGHGAWYSVTKKVIQNRDFIWLKSKA